MPTTFPLLFKVFLSLSLSVTERLGRRESHPSISFPPLFALFFFLFPSSFFHDRETLHGEIASHQLQGYLLFSPPSFPFFFGLSLSCSQPSMKASRMRRRLLDSPPSPTLFFFPRYLSPPSCGHALPLIFFFSFHIFFSLAGTDRKGHQVAIPIHPPHLFSPFSFSFSVFSFTWSRPLSGS